MAQAQRATGGDLTPTAGTAEFVTGANLATGPAPGIRHGTGRRP